MSEKHSIIKSFSYAFAGIKTALKNEHNIRIHLLIAFATIIAGIFLKLNKYEWIILLFTIFLVIILELINTSLEAIVDLVSPQIQEKAKIAKDVSAAAVMVSAIFSIIIGVFIFLPKILQFIAK